MSTMIKSIETIIAAEIIEAFSKGFKLGKSVNHSIDKPEPVQELIEAFDAISEPVRNTSGFKSPKNKWSNDEVLLLKSHIGFSFSDILQLFPHRTEDSVRTKIHKLGYHVSKDTVLIKTT